MHRGGQVPAGCGSSVFGHRMECRLRPSRSQSSPRDRSCSLCTRWQWCWSPPGGQPIRCATSPKPPVGWQKPMRWTPRSWPISPRRAVPTVRPLPDSDTPELHSLTTRRNQVVSMLVADRPIPGAGTVRGPARPAFTAGVGQECADLAVFYPARRTTVAHQRTRSPSSGIHSRPPPAPRHRRPDALPRIPPGRRAPDLIPFEIW